MTSGQEDVVYGPSPVDSADFRARGAEIMSKVCAPDPDRLKAMSDADLPIPTWENDAVVVLMPNDKEYTALVEAHNPWHTVEEWRLIINRSRETT